MNNRYKQILSKESDSIKEADTDNSFVFNGKTLYCLGENYIDYKGGYDQNEYVQGHYIDEDGNEYKLYWVIDRPDMDNFEDIVSDWNNFEVVITTGNSFNDCVNTIIEHCPWLIKTDVEKVVPNIGMTDEDLGQFIADYYDYYQRENPDVIIRDLWVDVRINLSDSAITEAIKAVKNQLCYGYRETIDINGKDYILSQSETDSDLSLDLDDEAADYRRITVTL